MNELEDESLGGDTNIYNTSMNADLSGNKNLVWNIVQDHGIVLKTNPPLTSFSALSKPPIKFDY